MIPRFELAPGYDVSRLVLGGWQFSAGHRAEALDPDDVVELLVRIADAGVTTFDCADIYSGVEELYGRFLARWTTTSASAPLQIHTKFVPDLDALPTMSRTYVERIIDRSLRRLGVERLDLVQFYWWDHDVPGFEDTGGWLSELQAEGKIRHVAATNLNAARCRRLLGGGVDLAANQVQYSLLDRRPERSLVELAEESGMGLLCYGALAGGLLTDRWLGEAEPGKDFGTRSLVKYRLIVDELGGWSAFQRLLHVIRDIADEHGSTISAVALRFVLDQPCVAAVITGSTRLQQVEQNVAAFRTTLSAEDHARIRDVLGPGFGPPGDIYDLESDRGGRHGRIMRYNLNSG